MNIKLLRNTLTEPLSETEHQLFILACDRSGFDPFARQIYWMKREGRLVIEASIDGFRLAAERTGEYAGQVGPHWCGPDGKWLSIWTSGVPTAARVGVLRKDFRKPVWGKAVFAEYDQGGRFWRQMPTNQIAKCAEALAFCKPSRRSSPGCILQKKCRIRVVRLPLRNWYPPSQSAQSRQRVYTPSLVFIPITAGKRVIHLPPPCLCRCNRS